MTNVNINNIFSNIENLTLEDGQQEFMKSFCPVKADNDQAQEGNYVHNGFELQLSYLKKIIKEIDDLASNIQDDDTILISVKNQKLLQTCYQIITSLGISQCLLAGLGIKLSKRCVSAVLLPSLDLSDEQNYEMLTQCTLFFIRSYNIPVLKKIIITLHLSDFLAALIQLSFAPLRKPGTYGNFVMTEELNATLTKDRQTYIQAYEYLVVNCFQPTIMKELLVLQSVTDPKPPMFVKRIISKELSRRLLAPGGLLSLIRCFMESHVADTGINWKKIDMLSKIVSAKHGPGSEESYLTIICSQLMKILTLSNSPYLAAAIACVLSLNEKYPNSDHVRIMLRDTLQAFDYEQISTLSNLPGTILLTPQEIEQKVKILSASISSSNVKVPDALILPNLYILFLLGIKCTTNKDLKLKLKDTLLKCLESLGMKETGNIIKMFLFGRTVSTSFNIEIEEYNSGPTLKCTSTQAPHSTDTALIYFIELLESSTEYNFVQNVFESLLDMIIVLNEKRHQKLNEKLLTIDDEPNLINETDEQYSVILQILSEISTLPKIVTLLKTSPEIVLNFIEHFMLKVNINPNDECIAIALVLLNTVLTNSTKIKDMKIKVSQLIPILQMLSKSESSMTSLLSKESLSLMTDNYISDTEYKKAVTDAFDNLLPVRAHGLIALTRLLEARDVETVSNKHYIFCLFKEQLKDPDSYIYLSAINGIASLCIHFTDEVLNLLCKEFLHVSSEQNLNTKDIQNMIMEQRMKIGDIIVKVTKRLGEMAVVHKTILLNTMLCGCRDEEPFMRASALSNLAEIASVLHYKMGTIIYEVLHCVWCILNSDKAIECRRAAVLVINSLIRGMGKEVLIELKDDLLPIYRTLKNVYYDNNEDSVLKLHAQIALEELNSIVSNFIFPEIDMEKKIYVLDKPQDIFK